MAPIHSGLASAIVAAGARLAARGLIVAGEGNLSVRLPGDELLITPTGRRKDELAASDLVVVPLTPAADAPEPLSGAPRPSSDVRIHRAVYRARPDVRAVVHAHVPAAMALTLAGLRPDPADLPETALLLPDLPLVPFGEMGSDELAARVAAAFGAAPAGETLPRAVILERHGAVAVGSNADGARAIADASDALELVDVLCRVTRDAALLRAAGADSTGPQAAERAKAPRSGSESS